MNTDPYNSYQLTRGIYIKSHEPACFSSDVINCVYKNESLVSPGDVSFANLSYPVTSNVNLSAVKVGDPDSCSNLKSFGSQQTIDWIVNNNYNSSNNTTSNNGSSSSPIFFKGDCLGSLEDNANSPASICMKQPNCYGYNSDVLQSCNIVASPSPYDYKNTLQESVTSANVGLRGRDVVRHGGKDADELVLLSSYNDRDQVNQGRSCKSTIAIWVNRPVKVFRNWNGEDLALKSVREHMTIGDGTKLLILRAYLYHFHRLHRLITNENVSLELQAYKSDYLCSSCRPSGGSKVYEIKRQTTVGIPTTPFLDAAGPLGPFTGYLTVLKNSQYMKPTLQLLDELCLSCNCHKTN